MGRAAGGALLTVGRMVIIALAMVTFVAVIPAHADVAGDLEWSASIDGRPLAEIDSNRPLQLGLADQVPVTLDLANIGENELRVRSVRLDGRVMGLSFFSFTIRIDVVLGPGESTRREFNIDLDALASQATGVIPSYFSVLGQDRQVLADRRFPIDVQGSLLSVYGLFGLSVALVTVALLASLLVSIHGGRLASRNAWQRALFFLPVGLGVGLTLTFTLSALRLLIPSATAWLTLVLACGAVAFLIGYFLPLGRRADDDEADSGEHPDQDAGAGDVDDGTGRVVRPVPPVHGDCWRDRRGVMRRRLALLVVIAIGLVFALPGVSDAAAPRLTITLAPGDANRAVGDVVTLEATVTIVDDTGPLRVAGWSVRFFSSAGWSSAPVRTDAAGVARYVHRRTAEGTETIQASLVSTGCDQLTSGPTTQTWWNPVLTLAPNLATSFGTPGEEFALTARLTVGPDPLPGQTFHLLATSPTEGPFAPPDVTDTAGTGAVTFRWTRVRPTVDTILVSVPARGLSEPGRLIWDDLVLNIDTTQTTVGTVGVPFVVTATLTQGGETCQRTPGRLHGRAGCHHHHRAPPCRPGARADRNQRRGSSADGPNGQAVFSWFRTVPIRDVLTVSIPGFPLQSKTAEVFWRSPPPPPPDINRVRSADGATEAASQDPVAGVRDSWARPPFVPDAPPPVGLVLTQSPVNGRTGSVIRLTARVVVASAANRSLAGWPVVFRGSASGGWESPPVLTDSNGIAVLDRRLEAAAGTEQFSARLGFPACPAIDDGPITQQRRQPVIRLSPLDAESEVDTPFTLTAVLRDSESANSQPVAGSRLQLTAGFSAGSQPTPTPEATTDSTGTARFTWTRTVPGVDTITVVEIISTAEPARATTTHRWIAGQGPTTPSPNPPTPEPPTPEPPTPEPPTPEPPEITDPETPSPSPEIKSPSPPPPPPTPKPPAPKTPPPPPPTGDTTGTGRPGGELTVSGGGCRPGERATVYLGDRAIGEAVVNEDGTFSLRAVIPNLPLGQYQVRSSCGVTDTLVVDVTAPEAAGSQAPTAGATTAAVLLFFVLAGNAVLRWVGDASGGGGFHVG